MTNPFISSRFLIREKPIAYPFYDLIHQDSQGPVFDLNVQMDSYDGSVYLRTDHVIEMGRTLGMATKEEVESLREIITELRRQINTLPFAQEELKSGIDDLVARFYSTINTLHSEPSLPPIGDTVAEPDPPKPAETERKTIGSISL